MSDIVDNAFFIIETPPLLNRVNNSTSKTASQKEFLINRAIPFEHYSQNDIHGVSVIATQPLKGEEVCNLTGGEKCTNASPVACALT